MGGTDDDSGDDKKKNKRKTASNEQKQGRFKKFGFLKKGKSSTSVLPTGANALQVMPDLNESDPAPELPTKLEGVIFLKRHKKRRINRNKRYFARLNPILEHEFKIDLSQVTILYDDNQRRLILTFKLESHQLQPENKDHYFVWKESIHKHRLYRQDLIRNGLGKDSDHSLRSEFSNLQKELANARNNGNLPADDKKYTSALDALTRAMEEYQNVHNSAMDAVKEMKKLTELSRSMFAEIKIVWFDLRNNVTNKTTTTPNENLKNEVVVTNLNDIEPKVTTANGTSTEHSDDEDEDDDEEEVCQVQDNLPDKSLKTLEAARTTKKIKSKEEPQSPDGKITKKDANIIPPIKKKIEEQQPPSSAPKPQIQKPIEKKEEIKPVITVTEKLPSQIQPKQVEVSRPQPQQQPPPPKPIEKPQIVPPSKPPRIHREILPSPQMPGEALSFTVIAAAAMKGSLPISTYEPLGMLQVLCEELRFVPQTINKALNCSEPVDRMCYIAAFAMSAYSAMIGRNRKPFNPLLGETFDYISEDGWKYHGEQVGHHPATSAVTAIGKNFEWWQTATGAAKTNAWSGTVEVQPELPVRLRLNLGNNNYEDYSWNKVKTIIQNATAAPENRIVKNEGIMLIKCSNGIECKLTFKGDKCGISGDIKKYGNGQQICKLVGRWDKGLNKIYNDEQDGLFEVPSRDIISKNYYGFSKFTMTLNELFNDDKLFLPITDSRFRPDQRYLENGDGKNAIHAKQMIENEQRTRNKCGKTAKQLWFELKNDDFTKKNMWFDNGKYWIMKEKQFNDPYFLTNVTQIFL
uniref:Oxysterol-binding protein n=1 Tax=Panagrolaimus sp. JU765 TaxID=591449 RepID=A0AC34Q7U4_9BILA